MAKRPKRNEPAAPARRGGVRRPSSGSLLFLVVIVIGVATLTPTVNQLIDQQIRIADLRQEINEASERTEMLKIEQQRWSDPAFIRSQARGRLLFISPGDTSYTVLDSAGSDAPRAPIEVSADQHTTKSDPAALYLDTLVRSAAAGSDSAAAEQEPAETIPAPTVEETP